jgi:DNA-binding MarR family transcriptional regulator
MRNNQELLSLLVDMAKAVRCCQQDSSYGDGITFTQFYIINLIAKHGTLRLTDLHALLSVEKSTSTRLIDPIVQRGFVKKERCASDCRAIDLTLTEKGHETNVEHWKCLNNFFDQFWTEIPEDQQEEVFSCVVIFLQAVKKVFNNPVPG